MALPGAPTALVATAGDNQASIAFTATGATPAVTAYQYRSRATGAYTTAAQTASPVIAKGLQNGKLYTISLRAVNADGPGTAATVQVTPTDATPLNNNGFTDASWAANVGAPVPQLDYNDPDD